MKVRMLKDSPGSPDGVTVNQYAKGVVYDVSHALGTTFVKFGHAVEHEVAVVEKVVEKAIPNLAPAPRRSKKLDGPEENK